jgi:hypothetical protein
MTSRRPIFVTEWRAAPGIDGVRALRALLKLSLRRFSLHCISAREELKTESLDRRHRRPRTIRRHNLEGNKMRKDEVFPSKYLKASDLNGKPRVFTIEEAPLLTLKNTKGEEQQKTVLFFTGEKKTLPLNMTNWDAVASIGGGDTDDWPGHKIELYPTKTSMAGRPVDCIRVRAPESSPKKKQLQQSAVADIGDDGDFGAGPEDHDDVVPI